MLQINRTNARMVANTCPLPGTIAAQSRYSTGPLVLLPFENTFYTDVVYDSSSNQILTLKQ